MFTMLPLLLSRDDTCLHMPTIGYPLMAFVVKVVAKVGPRVVNVVHLHISDQIWVQTCIDIFI